MMFLPIWLAAWHGILAAFSRNYKTNWWYFSDVAHENDDYQFMDKIVSNINDNDTNNNFAADDDDFVYGTGSAIGQFLANNIFFVLFLGGIYSFVPYLVAVFSTACCGQKVDGHELFIQQISIARTAPNRRTTTTTTTTGEEEQQQEQRIIIKYRVLVRYRLPSTRSASSGSADGGSNAHHNNDRIILRTNVASFEDFDSREEAEQFVERFDHVMLSWCCPTQFFWVVPAQRLMHGRILCLGVLLVGFGFPIVVFVHFGFFAEPLEYIGMSTTAAHVSCGLAYGIMTAVALVHSTRKQFFPTTSSYHPLPTRTETTNSGTSTSGSSNDNDDETANSDNDEDVLC